MLKGRTRMLLRFFGKAPRQGCEVTGRGGEDGGRSRRSRRRPRVEALEGRQLLATGITEFPLPGTWTAASAIAAGADGHVWVALSNRGEIDRITPDGTITAFPVSGASNSVLISGLTAGPDGAVWFTGSGFTPMVGRIAADGTVAEFPLAVDPGNPLGAGSAPTAIVAGPDGNLWVTESAGGTIDRVTPAGVVTAFALPASGSHPTGIAAGPDGALWFTEIGKIGRITTDGTVTEFAAPASGGQIAAGPDGALWFTDPMTDRVGRITTAGQVTVFAVPTPYAEPTAIAAGPDGALWFTEREANKVGRITTDGTVVEIPLNAAPDNPFGLGNVPSGIVTGPDGALWITEMGSDKVARLDLRDAFYAAGGATLYAQPGTPLGPVVASIVDTRPGASLADFSATIDWGDGSSSAGTITAGPGGVFAISGSHTYAAAGTFPIVVTIQDGRTGEALTADTSASITVPPGFTVGPGGTLVPDDPTVTPIDIVIAPPQALNSGPVAPSATVVPATTTPTPAATPATAPGPETLGAAGRRMVNIFESQLLARLAKLHHGPVAHARHAKVFAPISQRAFHLRRPR
jgi:virginiamycin B lyase